MDILANFDKAVNYFVAGKENLDQWTFVDLVQNCNLDFEMAANCLAADNSGFERAEWFPGAQGNLCPAPEPVNQHW